MILSKHTDARHTECKIQIIQIDKQLLSHMYRKLSNHRQSTYIMYMERSIYEITKSRLSEDLSLMKAKSHKQDWRVDDQWAQYICYEESRCFQMLLKCCVYQHMNLQIPRQVLVFQHRH